MRFAFNYVIVLSGCGITILMQSSCVTTSTLTPLVWLRCSLSLMTHMFVQRFSGFGLTVALSHLFFIVVGALIWYPLPFARAVAHLMSRFLRSIAADIGPFLLWYNSYMFVAIHVMLLGFSWRALGILVPTVIEFVRSRTAAWRL